MLGPSGQAPPLRLVDDAGREHRQLAVVLVPNNPYALDRPPPRPRSTPASSGLSFSTCLATVRPSRGQPWAAPDLEVSALRSVPAGIDGEAVQLSPPLRFVIRPARLRVRISARHPGASPAARFPLSRA